MNLDTSSCIIVLRQYDKMEGWINDMELQYSASLTGAGFMLYEFKQVAKLKNEGYSDQDIRKKVIEENLFEHQKISSVKRGLPSIIRRVNTLNDELRDMVMTEPIETQKIINLLAIMKTDRLFFEFMNEVIKEKILANDYHFERKDVNLFFSIKIEEVDTIANWSDETIKKLKQVHQKILLETGLLSALKSGELNRLFVDEHVRRQFNYIDGKKYLRALGEE